MCVVTGPPGNEWTVLGPEPSGPPQPTQRSCMLRILAAGSDVARLAKGDVVLVRRLRCARNGSALSRDGAS